MLKKSYFTSGEIFSKGIWQTYQELTCSSGKVELKSSVKISHFLHNFSFLSFLVNIVSTMNSDC